MTRVNGWVDAASGAGAGAIAKTLTAPLERVKLVLQNQELAASRATPVSGLRDGLRQLSAERGGARTLWRGNGTNLLRVLPTYAVRFGLFPRLEELLEPVGLQADVRRLLSGALAGAGALLLTHPLDTVRTRLAAQREGQRMYAGALDCLRSTWAKEGLAGIYAGCGVSLLEIAPYSAIAFAGYEGMKQRLSRDGLPATAEVRLLAGFTSGCMASFLCYPLDTVRRQLMLDGSRGFESRYDRSTLRCATRLWSEGGVKRLYRGYTATLVKSVPSVAITFFANDCIRSSLSGSCGL